MTKWHRYVREHLAPLNIGAEREVEIIDELAQQLESAYETALARGATEEDARHQAEAEVPDWGALAQTLSRIEHPVASRVPPPLRPSNDAAFIGVSRGGFMSGFIQDLRYAVRTLTHVPSFTVVAVLTLALGIGATTVVYSLVDGILLKPLPIKDPGRVMLGLEVSARGEITVSWLNFLDWQKRARSFENLAAWRGLPANLTGTDAPRRILTRHVTWNLFDVLGVQPVIGRPLTQADDQPGVERVCLVSYGFWQRELGGDPAAIGRRITLDEVPVTVVGVLPADFTVARREDAFIPLGTYLNEGSPLHSRGNHNGLVAVGRLAPGATVESARSELVTIAAQLAQEYPATNTGISATLQPILEALVSDVRQTLIVLLGAVLAMLLIACVNLANLLLARSSSRAQELAVRRALGAGGWRVVRQLLTESVLLAVGGGIGGVLLAWAGFGAFIALLPSDQPRVHIVTLDMRVLAVAAAVSMFTGILFGLLPALHAARGRSMSLLRNVRVTGAPSSRHTTRRMLLLAEVALALVLLAGAGLMVRTMTNLMAIDVGFEPAGLVSAQLSLPVARYAPDQRRVFYDAVVERTRAVPGVENAALTLSLPVQGSNWNSVFIVDDRPIPARSDIVSAAFTPVTPSYHETMGIRMIAGRLFHRSDGPASTTVAIVNETFAKRFWPNGDAIGRRLKQGWPEDQAPWREIVGIVRDVKTSGVNRPPALQVYLPLAQSPSTGIAIVARVRGNANAMGGPIEAAIHDVDPNLPVYDVRTLEEVIGRGVGQQRLTMVFLLGFAALAVIMAAVGVFGVTAYGVSQRTHEFGVRMALGANRAMVMRLVMREELLACLFGVVVGIGGALGLSWLLETLLFGVAPRDPATLAIVAAILIAVTGVAGYLPARRATRVDPVTALRIE